MFDTVVVADIIDLFEVIAGKPVDRIAAPQDFAAIGQPEPGENAQQAGFTATIGSFHHQHLPSIELKSEIFEQQAVVAHAAEIAGLE